MHPLDDDMHFGGADFSLPDLSVPDDMLGMDGGEPQMQLDPRQLGRTAPGMHMPDGSEPGMAPEETAQQVENSLLQFLVNGRHDVILMVSGDRPATAAVARGTDRLRMAYAQSVTVNPALRWYAKFASLLPAQKFGVNEGSLQIQMPAPMFRKVVRPFLADFRAEWAEASPMAAAVRSMAASLAASDRAATERNLAGGVRRQSNVEATDLDVAALGMNDLQVSDLPQTAEGTPFPPPAGNEPPAAAPTDPGPMVPRLPISLTDLSLKAVVDHIAGVDGDDDSLMQMLLENGFPKARANEIIAMLRYKRVSEARRAARYSPVGNRGMGSVEFTFR
jgi:hypothetical protein